MTALAEADTCREYLFPVLHAASRTDDRINGQKSFTGGRTP
jgi:hypothetical protein